MSTQGFQLDPSLSGLSDALLKTKYDQADPEERKRLGFVRQATPQEFAAANEPHYAPADFGGPVYSSSTAPVVSDDTDSGIPVTPMPMGVSWQKQNATSGPNFDTSRPPAAQLATPGLRTVGTHMATQPLFDMSKAKPISPPLFDMSKARSLATMDAADQIAANPPGLPKSRINVQEGSDPLGTLKRAPGMLLDAVTGSGMSGAGGLPVRPDDQGNLSTAGTEATRGVSELATPGSRLRGANRLARSMYDTASPALGPAALENPLGLAKVMAGGTLGQQGASETASAFGANPDQAEAIGNVGGIVGGMAGGFARAPQPAAPPERIPLWKRVQTAAPEVSPSSRLVDQISQPPTGYSPPQPVAEDPIEAARRGAPPEIAPEVQQVRQADIDRRIKFGSPEDRSRAVQENAALASPEVQDQGFQRSNDLQKRKMSQQREAGPSTREPNSYAGPPPDFLGERASQRLQSGVARPVAPPSTATPATPQAPARPRLADLMDDQAVRENMQQDMRRDFNQAYPRTASTKGELQQLVKQTNLRDASGNVVAYNVRPKQRLVEQMGGKPIESVTEGKGLKPGDPGYQWKVRRR